MKEGALIATMAPGWRPKVGMAVWYRALGRISYRVSREVFDKEAYIFFTDMAIFDRDDGAPREHKVALMAGDNGPLPLIRDRGHAARRPLIARAVAMPIQTPRCLQRGPFPN